MAEKKKLTTRSKNGTAVVPLKSFKIKNFKSIRETEVEFKPLTVIVGSNSAGKTSLLQAIKLMSSQSSRTSRVDDPDIRYSLNTDLVKLGNIENVLNWNATNEMLPLVLSDFRWEREKMEDLLRSRFLAAQNDQSEEQLTEAAVKEMIDGIISQLIVASRAESDADEIIQEVISVELCPTFQWRILPPMGTRRLYDRDELLFPNYAVRFRYRDFHDHRPLRSFSRRMKVNPGDLRKGLSWSFSDDGTFSSPLVTAAWGVEFGDVYDQPQLRSSKMETHVTRSLSESSDALDSELLWKKRIVEEFYFAESEDPDFSTRHVVERHPVFAQSFSSGEGTLKIEEEGSPYVSSKTREWSLVGANSEGGLNFNYYYRRSELEHLFDSISSHLGLIRRLQQTMPQPETKGAPMFRDSMPVDKEWFAGFLAWLCDWEVDARDLIAIGADTVFPTKSDVVPYNLQNMIGRYTQLPYKEVNLNPALTLEESLEILEIGELWELLEKSGKKIDDPGDLSKEKLIELLDDYDFACELSDEYNISSKASGRRGESSLSSSESLRIFDFENSFEPYGQEVLKDLILLFEEEGELNIFEYLETSGYFESQDQPRYPDKVCFHEYESDDLSIMRNVRQGIQNLLQNIRCSDPVRNLDSLKFVASRLYEDGPHMRPEGYLLPWTREEEDFFKSGEPHPDFLISISEEEPIQPFFPPILFATNKSVTLNSALAEWMIWFGLAKQVNADEDFRDANSIRVIPIGSEKEVGLTAVGEGVTQALDPILTCLMSRKGDLILLEEPELHLHPALQKKMAEFLHIFAHNDRQIIVTTHGEHVVNRLRTLAAEDTTNLVHQNIQLLFAAKDDEGNTEYTPSEINQYGGVSEDWPDGFLDESAKSSRELLTAGLEKRKAELDEEAKE